MKIERRPTHFYAFGSADPVDTCWFSNVASTLKEAREDIAWLKREGCLCGPIVKVPIPHRDKP